MRKVPDAQDDAPDGGREAGMMQTRFRTIGLTGNWRDRRAIEAAELMARHLTERDCTVVVEDDFPGTALPAAAQRLPGGEIPAAVKLLIAVGGDGTMLRAARRAALAEVPLLGINRGRLGFLADISSADMLAALDHVLAGDFSADERMLLDAELLPADGPPITGLALNDVVVKRLDSGRMFEFETFIDGRYVNTHAGDGFIVATPTGSTAYALSCGGPIITPELAAIVLAPICPHTLSDRPIVIPGHSRTEIRLVQQDVDSAAVCCDGEVIGELGADDRLLVAASQQRLRLLHPPGHDFFEVLRGKLHWGRGRRSQNGGA